MGGGRPTIQNGKGSFQHNLLEGGSGFTVLLAQTPIDTVLYKS